MSSFRGPKGKVARSLGVAVSQKTQKALDRRNFAPGQHGQTRKKSASVYKQQLVEKQRLRFTYNISEAQLAKAYKEANRREGSAGDNLMILLETRLDAVVFRMGFARTIFAARQYVAHGHFTVNGVRSFSPSRLIKAGDVVAVRDIHGNRIYRRKRRRHKRHRHKHKKQFNFIHHNLNLHDGIVVGCWSLVISRWSLVTRQIRILFEE